MDLDLQLRRGRHLRRRHHGDLPTLYLPVDETVRFELTSPDVIHSFWIVPFLMKMDVIPGRTNQFELTPTQLGTFKGKCAELCGVDHSRMLFEVKVVTPEEYAQHQIDLRARGQVGLLADGRTTDDADGRQGRHDHRRDAVTLLDEPGAAAAPVDGRAAAHARAPRQDHRLLDHDHRPQGDRLHVPDHVVRVLPVRRR